MCGIAGIYGEDNENLLNGMLKTIKHRGPDETGSYVSSNISFGANRLSIVDIERGSQPQYNERKSVCVVFNGEIYNFRSLRKGLERKGHKFQTNCDTEVLPHLYEEYGKRFVEKLRGMFAFALWDSDSEKLILGRDRFGIKPLYYTKVKDRFLFSSEIKAFFEDVDFKPEISERAVGKFLKLRYIPRPETIFNSVKKLRPGEILLYGNEIRKGKYWGCNPSAKTGSGEIRKGGIAERIGKSVRKRLMGDVPIGVFISGGLDSTAVLHFSKKYSEKRPRTYSISFSEDPSDESEYAEFVSDYYSTDHTTIPFQGLNMETLNEIVWHLDEPMADPTSIPNYLLSERASEDCKVVLTGEGADEIFGGYEQYRYMQLKRKYSLLFDLLSRIIPKFPGDMFSGRVTQAVKSKNDSSTYSKLVSIFNDEELKKYFQINPDFSNPFESYFKSQELADNMMKFDIENWLVDDLLMKLDKTTMANSIEGRVPFLDLNLYEIGSSLPLSSKINDGHLKYILKESLKEKIPRRIRKRKKQRFFLPLDTYFRGEFKERCLQILEDPKIFEALDSTEFSGSRKIVDKMNSWGYRLLESRSDKSRMYYLRQLWNVLILELWYRKVESYLA